MNNTIEKKELCCINGGLLKISSAKLIGVGFGISFIIGLVSGIVRPYSCSSGK